MGREQLDFLSETVPIDDFDRIFKIGRTGLLSHFHSISLTPASTSISYICGGDCVDLAGGARNGSRSDVTSQIKY